MRGPIIQRAPLVLDDFNPLFVREFFRQHVRIESRTAGHRQNIPVGRIQRDDGTRLLPKKIFGGFLKPGIDGEIQIVSGDRLVRHHGAFFVAECIDFHALLPRAPAHLPVEPLLYSILPDHAALMEIGKVRLFKLIRRHFSHISQ